MAGSDEILAVITEVRVKQEDLLLRLYGQESDPGDIPAIRIHLEKLNGKVQRHDKILMVLKWFAVLLVLGGGGSGLATKLMALW